MNAIIQTAKKEIRLIAVLASIFLLLGLIAGLNALLFFAAVLAFWLFGWNKNWLVGAAALAAIACPFLLLGEQAAAQQAGILVFYLLLAGTVLEIFPRNATK